LVNIFRIFASKFTSNIKETGVWISGFYGSGKSYFGKMLGYVLENSDILGTPAVERFVQRLAGLKNAGLIENDIRPFQHPDTRVVSLDIAKQSTTPRTFICVISKFFEIPWLSGQCIRIHRV